MKKVEERFLEYIKIDTKSDETTKVTPSTKGQLEFGKVLASELKNLGLSDVKISNDGYIYATLEGNLDKKVPTIGFIAHMDTAPDMDGKCVNPKIVENYDGKDIKLNDSVILSPEFSPELKGYIGQTLITTDGTTLLGADDKAGVSEIMTAVEYLINHPEIKHGDIKIAFTPDEEIGEGADHFDVEGFGADFAYTLDGGHIGELEYENFNAATATVLIKGTNVHPGYAKGKMVNSMMLAHEFISKLPLDEVPEKTEKYEGFSHLISMSGEVEETKLVFIIRDFFEDTYESRKERFVEIEKELNKKYGENRVTVEIKDSYKNMKEKVEPVMYIVDMAKKAMESANVTPLVKPIRGGTDGARLSFMGLPTPNIFTGGENFHGKYEYIPVESMRKAVDVILNIVKENNNL
ncbi:MAG: peptidase T [Sarcina ventriculi]|uniref:Peptidase T n=1 Tax=Sarcina ventriculi TaxID=1267 RepID=A0ABP2AS03_SARVE|nr:peptidase T [Sarcina ventriculi]MDO4401612.1 peptidase T [Clostridiaceae bacterium]MBU5323301.1 peptidase T [Sarcina ventriculi]MCI5635923.1 peptidase T [Sarcina ventriculi]MDD7372608.1 peptidase T [Sarcina ventriculi]MDY7061550.1 peptidase T [Sarcina ventriculi]